MRKALKRAKSRHIRGDDSDADGNFGDNDPAVASQATMQEKSAAVARVLRKVSKKVTHVQEKQVINYIGLCKV